MAVARPRGDGADVEQLDDGEDGPHGDRDHRPHREAAAGQGHLDRPGEGGVPDPEPGRGDQRHHRGDEADRLRGAHLRQLEKGM